MAVMEDALDWFNAEVSESILRHIKEWADECGLTPGETEEAVKESQLKVTEEDGVVTAKFFDEPCIKVTMDFQGAHFEVLVADQCENKTCFQTVYLDEMVYFWNHDLRETYGGLPEMPMFN